MNELSERDQLLAKRLSATLERSTQQPDPALDQALRAARQRALGDLKPARQALRPWLWASGMALAAGLAMFVVLPGGGSAPIAPAAHTTASARAAVDDPEMLEDMDMLQALAVQPAGPGQG
jgi:hypothetical protein